LDVVEFVELIEAIVRPCHSVTSWR
jgi:hypothetical protein